MGFKRLERILRECFRKYGHFVGSKPLPFFFIPLLVTILISPCLFLMKYDNSVIRLFTPYHAPSLHEFATYKAFLSAVPFVPPSSTISTQSDGDISSPKTQGDESGPPSDQGDVAASKTESGADRHILLQIDPNNARASSPFNFGMAYRNRSNIMTVEAWSAFSDLLDYIYHNFTCSVERELDGWRPVARRGSTSSSSAFGDALLRYSPDFCQENNPQCPKINVYTRQIASVINRTNTAGRGEQSSRIVATYPVMYLWDQPVNWGQFIFGASVNGSGYLESAKMVLMQMEWEYNSSAISEPSAKQCMAELLQFIRSYQSPTEADDEGQNDDLRFYVNSEWFQDEQVTETRDKLLPLIPITAALVTVFTLVSSYYSRSPLVGALEALLGALTIGMSMVTSFAFMFACGVPFNFVVMITPFLTLCVGIDNDFLLMASWRRPCVAKLSRRKRLAEAFVDSGPSLTITSVNDILCFAVGTLSDAPAVSYFCLYSCVSLTFRFLYQLTFFSAAILYADEYGEAVADWLRKMIRKLTTIHRVWSGGPGTTVGDWFSEIQKKESAVSVLDGKQRPPSVDQDHHDQPTTDDSYLQGEHVMHKFFRTHYSSFVAGKSVRLLIAFGFLAYLIFAFVFASKLKIDISLLKLVYDGSPSKEYYGLSEEYVLSTQLGAVIVMKAPDFRQQSNIDRFMQFVDAFESTEYSPENKDTTGLWLRHYRDFLSYASDPSLNGSDFYDYLPDFLSSSQENERYAADVRFNYTSDDVADRKLFVPSFKFSTYYRNVFTWDDSAKLMMEWRKICKNFSEYEAIVQDPYLRNAYLDQRLSLPSNTLQTMSIASLMIAFVTALLMPDLASMFFISFSSFSVDLGVIATLILWGSDLDPVMMGCLLMTIGFSVYYTARMCYCYQQANPKWKTKEKFAYTLGAIGWPILQGGLGTTIGIIPLAFGAGYMMRTFFHTIVLVVAIGLLHGLLFMPVMMSLYDSSPPPFRKWRRKAMWCAA